MIKTNKIIKAPYYRLYIDESGDHAYRNLDYVSHRYLGLLGVIFERVNDYQRAADELKKVKEKYWPKQDPDKPVIFHRIDMVNFRGYFSKFRDEAVRKEFDNNLINYVKNQKFIIINVVLDKKGMLGNTSTL